MKKKRTEPSKKTIYHLTRNIRTVVDTFIMRRSLLPDKAVFDPYIFPWVRELERNWQAICKEAILVQASNMPSLGEISPDHRRIAADTRWRTFFFGRLWV